MSDIKVINLNRVQVKLSDTDDPVALKTNWEPLKPGGASFKTQKLVEYERLGRHVCRRRSVFI